MKSFDYECDSCGESKTNLEMSSFVCECGGSMRLLSNVMANIFQPFYSREMKTYIKSAKHEEQMLRKKGFAYLSDHPKLVQEARSIKRHEKDYIKTQHDEQGKPGWKPGLVFDDLKKGFVKKVAILLIFFSTTAYADIKGVDYAELTINGVSYHVPIGNKERQMDLLLLKKALNGDKDAREIFLGGQEEKYFPIGDEKAVWLKMTKYTQEVITT